MKLVNANVRRYRSIEDGGDVAIQPDVTCLVGKNESGKTAVLQALYKSNPIEKSISFDAGIDYPSRLTRERKETGQKPVTVLTYELSDEDVAALEKSFGKGVVNSSTVEVTTGYDFSVASEWTVNVNEPAVVSHLKAGIELPPKAQATVDEATTTADLAAALSALETPTSASTAVVATITGWRQSRLSLAVIDALQPRRPKFVYFGDYDSMPGKVSIPNLIAKRDADTLSRGEQAVLSLLDIAGVSPEDFLNPETHEHLIRDSENASNAISEEVFEYWSQNKNLAVKLTDIGKAEAGAAPPLDEAPLLQIRVENQRHRVTVPFDDRSRGFVWFFSFLAYFSQIEDNARQPLILLLDEPGINLHASAQADLLRFIDERLAPKHQVIFSTHSPFMINPHALERVRTVTDADGKGTVFSSDILQADAETSFPLHAALGIELAQTLFIAPDVLLVEGPSDLIFIEVLSNLLKAAGREGLDDRWAVTPVGGAGKLPAFVTLLGANKINTVVLADSAGDNSGPLDRLRAAGKLGAAGVILIGEATGAENADIEDLFEADFYLGLVNEAYQGALAGTKLSVTDLPADERLIRRVERAFEARNVNGGKVNHFAPAAALLRSKAPSSKISEKTLDRAELLFNKINKQLSS